MVAGVLVPEVGAGDRVALLDAVALAEEEELAPGLVVEWLEADPLAEVVEVGAELVPDSEEEEEEEVEDGDGEHPASTTVRMAKTPKPLTASFALSTVPAMVPRTVM